MAKWWKPTAANYLHHLAKERTLSVLAETISKQAAAPLEKIKNEASAEAAKRALADVAWLPEPLRVG
jgi:ParB family chromosome partitioning protein